MKILILSLALIMSFINLSFSQNTEADIDKKEEEIIKTIRQKYNSIQENSSTYDTTTVDVLGESVEAGQLIGYYDTKINDELKVMQMSWFGEGEKNVITFYLDKDELFFIFEQRFIYNTSIYITKEVAKANEVTAFDIRKSKIEENRYYLDNGNLFRWTNPKKEKMDLTLKQNNHKEKELKKDFARLNKKLK